MEGNVQGKSGDSEETVIVQILLLLYLVYFFFSCWLFLSSKILSLDLFPLRSRAGYALLGIPLDPKKIILK